MKLLYTVIILYSLTAPDHTDAQTIEAGPETAFPVGDLSETNNIGYGGAFRFMYPLMEEMNMHFTVGYLHFPSDEDYRPASYYTISDWNLEYDVVPLQTGISFRTPVGIFIDLYAGVHIRRLKETIDFQYYTYIEDTTEVKFSLGIGAGYRLDLNSYSSITVSAVYQSIQQSRRSAAYLALRAAYLYKF